VKETLLGHDPPDRTTINIAGGGARLVGGSVRVELARDEVERVLVDGFLPRVGLDESRRPAVGVSRSSGCRTRRTPRSPDTSRRS
jgi:hypothetical protein